MPDFSTPFYDLYLNGEFLRTETTNTFADLAAGDYRVETLVGDCRYETTFTINPGIPGFTLDLQVTDLTCPGDLATLTAVPSLSGFDFEFSLNGGDSGSDSVFTALPTGAGYFVLAQIVGTECSFGDEVNISTPPALMVGVEVADASCGSDDGVIEVFSGAGSEVNPVAYELLNVRPRQTSSVFTGLAPGTYTVVAYDERGCSVTETVSVGQGGLGFTATATLISDVRCNGENNGGFYVAITGNAVDYEYSLNGGPFAADSLFSGLVVGDYSVEARPVGSTDCAATTSITISEPTAIEFTAEAVPFVCDDAPGGVRFDPPTGGAPPYEYAVADGEPFQPEPFVGNLTPGTYTAVVRDATGCAARQTVTILDNSVAFTLINTNDVSCAGSADGSATVSDLGEGTRYEVFLDGASLRTTNTNEIGDLPAGDYRVVAERDGCSYEVVFTIEETVPRFTVDLERSGVNCADDEPQLIAIPSITGFDFDYQLNGGPVQADSVFTGLSFDQVYAITVTVVGTECVAGAEIFLPAPPAIDVAVEVAAANCGDRNGAISVFPTDRNEVELAGFELIDVRPRQNRSTFDDLPAGIYTLVVYDFRGCSQTQLVTVDQRGANFQAFVREQGNVSCAGAADGAFVLTVDGPGEGYEFSVNGSRFSEQNVYQNLAPGVYAVEVRPVRTEDCSVFLTVEISAPDPISFEVEPSTFQCDAQPGRADVTEPAGGTSPYRYSLDGGVTTQTNENFENLAPGDYTLTLIDANGCRATRDFRINEGVVDFQITTDVRNDNCGRDGGTVTVGVGGGPLPAGWRALLDGAPSADNNGLFDDVSVGPHTVRVIEPQGCFLETEVVVGDDSDDFSSFTAVTTPDYCGDTTGTIMVALPNLTAAGVFVTFNLPFDPTQSGPVFTGLPSGLYLITAVTSNGCEESFSAFVGAERVVPELSPVVLAAPTCAEPTSGSVALNLFNTGGLDYEFSIDSSDFQPDSLFTGLASGTYRLTVRTATGGCAQTVFVEVPEVPSFSLIVEEGFIGCGEAAGAELSIAGQGGVAPYRYSIDGGGQFFPNGQFTDLPAGTYEVVVLDAAGCRVETTVTLIDGSQPLSIALTGMPSMCPGGVAGTAEVRVLSGSGPFTYIWSDGGTDSLRTNLPEGTYGVTVTNPFGCADSATLELINPRVRLAATVTPETCDMGGGIELDTLASDSIVLILWADGAEGPLRTGLAPGAYPVQLSNSIGCKIDTSYVIAETPPLFEAFPDLQVCQGSARLVIPSFPVRDIEWATQDGLLLSMDDTLLIAGDERIRVRGVDINGCSFADDFTVSETAGALTAHFLVADQAVVGDTVVLVENSAPAPDDVEWTITGPGNVVTIGQDLNQHLFRFDSVGVYQLTLTVLLGDCEAQLSKTIEIVGDRAELVEPAQLFSEIESLTVFPNPTDGPFTARVSLSGAPRNITMRLYDTRGQLLDSASGDARLGLDQRFDLSQREAGAYVLVVGVGTSVRYRTVIRR